MVKKLQKLEKRLLEHFIKLETQSNLEDPEYAAYTAAVSRYAYGPPRYKNLEAAVHGAIQEYLESYDGFPSELAALDGNPMHVADGHMRYCELLPVEKLRLLNAMLAHLES